MGLSDTAAAPLEAHFEQLAASHRAAWKGGHAVAVLALALAHSDAWWDHVEAVQAGADPLKLARRYGNGRRGRVVALLLQRAASEAPRSDAARMRMVNVAAPAWFPDDPPPASRAFREDYRRRLVLGAESIARRGAGRCIGCAAKIAGDGGRRDYCSPCGNRDRWERRREAMREVFEAAHSALRGRRAKDGREAPRAFLLAPGVHVSAEELAAVEAANPPAAGGEVGADLFLYRR